MKKLSVKKMDQAMIRGMELLFCPLIPGIWKNHLLIWKYKERLAS